MGGDMVKVLLALALLLVVVVFVANRIVHASKNEQNNAVSPMAPGTLKVVGASDAARRSLCLASILARTNLESESKLESADKSSDSSNQIFQDNQRHFIQGSGLWDALSSHQRTLLEKPLGSWSTQDIADGQWRAEALGCLLWALKQIGDLAPYDKQIPIANLPAPTTGASARFIRNAALRNENEITEARSTAELWLWRARTTQLQLSGAAPPDGWTFDKIIAKAAEAALSKKVFLPIDHDFPVLNKAYSKLSEEEWRTMRSIAQERLYALNWLCRYAADWDAVPTGT